MALLTFWSVKPKAPATIAMTTKASASTSSVNVPPVKEAPSLGESGSKEAALQETSSDVSTGQAAETTPELGGAADASIVEIGRPESITSSSAPVEANPVADALPSAHDVEIPLAPSTAAQSPAVATVALEPVEETAYPSPPASPKAQEHPESALVPVEETPATPMPHTDVPPAAPVAEEVDSAPSLPVAVTLPEEPSADAPPALPKPEPKGAPPRRFSFKALTSWMHHPPSPAALPAHPEDEVPAAATPSDKTAGGAPSKHARHASASETHKPAALSAGALNARRSRATRALTRHLVRGAAADARAREGAQLVRQLIAGPGVAARAPPPPPAAVRHVKGALLDPRAANALIAQLRALPPAPDALAPSGAPPPIHAVCLPLTEREAAERHFDRLGAQGESAEGEVAAFGVPSVLSAPVDAIADALRGLNLVDLVGHDMDLGIGQPGDGPGILAGAVPTAETVINGIVQITPQLMNLGYATSKAILPDHKGVHPPTDRMSVLTYWWGLEVCLPPPSLEYLSHVPSVAHAVVNFLTALAVIHNGVREILPFVRYISQYIDFEFNSIKQMDKGQGVVCAATWIMPAALVARPWDFELPEMPAKRLDADSPPKDSESTPVPVPPSESDAVAPAIPAHPSTSTPVLPPSVPVAAGAVDKQ